MSDPEVRIEPTQIAKFAAVFAEAVLTFLDSGEAQWLTWDGVSHRFDFASVEMDEPQQLVLLHVDAGWEQLAGDVGEITDPEHTHYDMDALRDAIEHQLTEEGVGEKILREFLRRLHRLEEDAEQDEQPQVSEDDA
ncbi:MAG TPA: hypothetical protein VHE37_01330 [Nevskiaceae bacterium]|nr:hypothetical protein [Nevskiaceae bacterium]